MITEVFYWTLNMGISGAATGCVVLLLRHIKRLPHRYICYLWLLPLIRMCIPFSLSSKYSLLTFVARFATKSVPVASVPQDLPGLFYTNFIMAANSYNKPATSPLAEASFVFKTESLEKVFSAGAIVWCIVFVAALLAMVTLYVMSKKTLKHAKPLYGNIYVSDQVTSPALYSVFRPRIIIPPYVSGETLSYVKAHEEAHLRRGDNLLRLIAIVVACIHWFNPFAWIMLKRYLADAELACDEAVLHKLGHDKKKEYAKALIDCEEGRTLFAPAFSSLFGGARLRGRIENILSYKKLTVASTIAFLILLASLAATLLTNAGA